MLRASVLNEKGDIVRVVSFTPTLLIFWPAGAIFGTGEQNQKIYGRNRGIKKQGMELEGIVARSARSKEILRPYKSCSL